MMLYKNLPESRLYITFIIRFLMDSAASLIFLLQFKFNYFGAVIKAYADFFRQKSSIKRDDLLVNRKLTGIYSGSIILSYFLRGSRLRFFDIGADIT